MKLLPCRDVTSSIGAFPSERRRYQDVTGHAALAQDAALTGSVPDALHFVLTRP
jgi:hypothetical protein